LANLQVVELEVATRGVARRDENGVCDEERVDVEAFVALGLGELPEAVDKAGEAEYDGRAELVVVGEEESVKTICEALPVASARTVSTEKVFPLASTSICATT
jgi:hypothetical protein